MISLSERAAEKVRELLADEADAETLRVAVQGGGCSGFQYALGFDGAPQSGDEIVLQHGVTVIVDRFSLPYLEGANVVLAARRLEPLEELAARGGGAALHRLCEHNPRRVLAGEDLS